MPLLVPHRGLEADSEEHAVGAGQPAKLALKRGVPGAQLPVLFLVGLLLHIADDGA
jgi:hypothetical protein